MSNKTALMILLRNIIKGPNNKDRMKLTCLFLSFFLFHAEHFFNL